MNQKDWHVELNERKWDARAAAYDQKRFDYFRWIRRRAIALIGSRLIAYPIKVHMAAKFFPPERV